MYLQDRTNKPPLKEREKSQEGKNNTNVSIQMLKMFNNRYNSIESYNRHSINTEPRLKTTADTETSQQRRKLKPDNYSSKLNKSLITTKVRPKNVIQ